MSLKGEIAKRAELIREAIPSIRPFRVRTVPKMRNINGTCQRKGWGRNAYYQITVSLEDGLELAVHTLCHEAAHVIAWKNANHGPRWGLAFSQTYRAAMGVR